MCRLSINLGASTSWNPQGTSRPVHGLLYILTLKMFILFTNKRYNILLLNTPIINFKTKKEMGQERMKYKKVSLSYPMLRADLSSL